MKKSPYDRERFFEKYSQMDRSRLGLAGAGEWGVRWSPCCRTSPGSGCWIWLRLRLALHLCGGTRRGGCHRRGPVGENAGRGPGKDHGSAGDLYPGGYAETPFPPESFDVVLSSLAIHYLPSFTDFLERVRQCLSPAATLSSLWSTPFHCCRSPGVVLRPGRHPLHFPVDRYFEEGRRTARFLGEDVTKYHRTLTTYLDGLARHGFRLERVVEPQPTPEMVRDIPGMADELRRPMMLIVRAERDEDQEL